MRTIVLLSAMALGAQCFPQAPCNVSLTVTQPSCPDDSNGVITVVPNTPGQYTYIWAQYPNLHAATANGLPVGNYSVTVMDTSGCVSVFDTVITPPPVPPLGTITATNISCAGLHNGSLTFTVNPGPYTWQWTDAPNLTDPVRTGLGPGVYVVLINGGPCPSWIFAELGDPDVTIGGNTTYCPADPPVLSADPHWGFQPDVWHWSTGDTTPSFTVPIGLSGQVSVTAIDTTTGCTSTANVTLTLLAPPVVHFTAPDSLCLRTSGTAILISSTADSLAWHWGTNGHSSEEFPVISFNQPYWQPISLQGYDSLGCGSAPLRDSVYVRPRFPAAFTVEQMPCAPGIAVHFDSAADSCAFFVGDSLVLGQCRGFNQVDLPRYAEYDFTFYSTRPDHCDDTAKVHIDVRTPPTAFLPNAFTPNGDHINDTWPGPLDIPDLDYDLKIFDRWGAFVWETANTAAKWDGADLPTGVYVYIMHMRDPCNPSEKLTRNGFIGLFR